MDYRHLFNAHTVRKPIDWDEVPTLHRLSADQIEAVASLPKREVAEEHGTFTKIEGYPVIELLLVMRYADDEPEYYYVNTEGYDYARYAVRLPNLLVESALRNT